MSGKQTNRMNGKRQSQWEVFDRCRKILLRLMQGSATNEELRQIVADHAMRNGEDIGVKALERRFEEDRRRLKDWFECEWTLDNHVYTLLDINRPLLDLPPEAIQALAFLRANFSNNAPMSDELDVLMSAVGRILPVSTRKQIEKQRRFLELEALVRDEDSIPEKIWDDIEKTTAEKRVLVFDYQNPEKTDGPRRHRVEPERYYVKNGHYYLDAYCIETSSVLGIYEPRCHISYRIGRISNTQPTPDHFPPRRRREEELVYVLSPRIVRLGVTQHFKAHQALSRPDGSVEIRALSYNLFSDLRTLLHYGPNCRVIGGSEALRMMAQLVREIAAVYENTETSPSL